MLQELRHTKTKAKSLLCKGLATILAASVWMFTAPAVLAGGGIQNAFAASDGNGWQIVDCAYDANHATSQGIASSDLSSHNFVESNDGQVRVTKTLEPTDVEDEFTVHLSVDTSATSVQVTDYYSFFVSAPYMGTESNTYKSLTPGSVTDKDAGAFGVAIGTSADKNSSVFDIYDPNNKRIAKDVTLYWNKAQNVTILLNIGKLLGLSSNEYILMGLSVKSGQRNALYLSQEAYNLINQAIEGAVNWGDPTQLKAVTDVMGDNVEYIGDTAAADGGTTNYDSVSRTLTWNPTYNSSYTTGGITSDVVTEVNDEGAVTKVTITQHKWYYGVASLTYKVRLNTQATDFESSYNPDNTTNLNYTNNSATLSYSYSTDGGSTYQNGSVDFPKPSVKGILYDIRLLKTNEIGTPIAGAIFKLTRTWTDSLGTEHVDVVADDLTSNSSGYVEATGLAWGTYTLTETQAPRGHNLPETEELRTCTFTLSYTSNKDALTASTITDASKNHAMIAGDTPSMQNERVKTDVTLLKVDSDTNDPLAGAKFALYADDGDGKFNATKDLTSTQIVTEQETDSDGKALYPQLTVGTYYLKETYAPAGYQLSTSIYRIYVYDVKGEAGGAEDNMIRVGSQDGSDMKAPSTANTVTIANRPIPKLPVTAGPGIGPMVGGGLTLLIAGAAVLVVYELRTRRQLQGARHLVLRE